MAFNINDGTDLTPEIIANYMEYGYLRNCTIHGFCNRLGFYCGITNDMDANYSRHKNDEFKGNDFQYVSIYRCRNADAAARVEKLMRQRRYDCGATTTFGNGGAEDSVFVYMFKKP